MTEHEHHTRGQVLRHAHEGGGVEHSFVEHSDPTPSYACVGCRGPMTFQGWFGEPAFRRYTCDAEGCPEKGTSRPEETLIAMAARRSMQATVHGRTIRYRPDDELGHGLVVVAEATLHFKQGDGSAIVQTISSPGLWGLSEQEDAAYLSEVEAEQNEILDAMLAALGLGR